MCIRNVSLDFDACPNIGILLLVQPESLNYLGNVLPSRASKDFHFLTKSFENGCVDTGDPKRALIWGRACQKFLGASEKPGHSD